MALGLLIGAYLLIAVIVVMYERCLRVQRSTLPQQSLSSPFVVPPQPDQLSLFQDDPEINIDPERFKAMFLNEDEEDIKHMLESGAIVKEQIPEVLDALGISNEVHFT